MFVASTGAETIIWKRVGPLPQILGGQVNPVVVSAPTMPCQAPVPKKSVGGLAAVKPSKPELNRRFAEPGAGAGGEIVTGGTTGAGAGAGGETVTGGIVTTGVGAVAAEGAGAVGVVAATAGAGAGEEAGVGEVVTAVVVAGAGEEAGASGVVTAVAVAPEGEVPPLLAALVRPAADVPLPPDVSPPAAPPLNAPPLAGAVPADDLPLSTRAALPPGVEVPPAAVLPLRFSVWPGI